MKSLVNWQICECFYYFLKVFYDAIICLSSVYYVTSYHAIHKLYEISNQFKMHTEVLIFSDAVTYMEEKFKKVLGENPLFLLHYCRT